MMPPGCLRAASPHRDQSVYLPTAGRKGSIVLLTSLIDLMLCLVDAVVVNELEHQAGFVL